MKLQKIIEQKELVVRAIEILDARDRDLGIFHKSSEGAIFAREVLNAILALEKLVAIGLPSTIGEQRLPIYPIVGAHPGYKDQATLKPRGFSSTDIFMVAEDAGIMGDLPERMERPSE